MSCPHGIWHEEDCEICTMEAAYEARIDKLEAVLEEIREALRALLLDYHITDDSRCSDRAWLALARADEAIDKIEGEM